VLFDRKLMALSRPQILLLRALGLGDFLTAVPAYRALRRAHPAATITLAAPAVLQPLVDLDGGIDRLLPVPGLGQLSWPDSPPTLAVNLHGRGPQSIEDLISTAASKLLTYRHPGFPGIPAPDWSAEEHEVDRWCRLLAWAGIAADPSDLLLRAPSRPSPARGAVVIHPGAAAPSRRWPAPRFADVARALAEQGEQVVVTGNEAERPLAAAVAEEAGLPPNHLLAGTLGLGDLAALVAGARLLVCGDTGVAHLGSAFATPSVLLFGPTPPDRWGPPAAGPHAVLWSGTTGDPHAAEPDPGLLRLTVDEVVDACRGQLAPAAEPALRIHPKARTGTTPMMSAGQRT
jgi:ADP-heptose:LPS heptosyltransferase